MFEHVEPFGGDPILSLNEDFQKDPRPGKINLSIGIYFDDAGRIPVLDSVRRVNTTNKLDTIVFGVSRDDVLGTRHGADDPGSKLQHQVPLLVADHVVDRFEVI